ncbi:hypothetical protein D0B54_22565 [Solimonas sp. K1W22B-7]|uniref:MbnP family protein n=1 Tax=Solimonas sp. K1W22B-7 TaxID=2303331 RepID=UPI000E32E82C|nr:MbnP family protein [Solimonas sp. K1W22B-7]AXQ31294.1 hypothetical protein D0B54_22565 [Solimonas sp. K1W22B-7]
MSRAGLLLLAALLGLCGCGREPALSLEVDISHEVGGQPLRLLEDSYRTAGGEEFSVRRLRYYLSQPRLRRKDGSWFVPVYAPESAEGYFLVDEARPASKRLRIGGVAAGEYSGIEFLLGVDDARNTAGVQTGALDPALGMFWTWKSGYIFFQLEGSSPQSTAQEHALSYHVGGGKPSLARRIYLPFGERPVKVDGKLLPTVHLGVNLALLFDGVSPVRIAQLSEAMDPAATRPLADNAAAMFRVDHLHHEPRRRGAP